MDIRLVNLEGKDVGTTPAFQAWESRAMPAVLLHQVAVASLRNRRVFRAHTKDRAERRGGGRKPWRQKGTGRARHGSIRSPLWRKGGITFGPRADRTYAGRTTAAMRLKALAGVLVGKVRDNEFFLLETLPAGSGKTRDLAALFGKMPVRGQTLFLVPGSKDTRTPFLRASHNLPLVRVANPMTVNVADLLQCSSVVTTPEGLGVLEERIRA